MVTRIDRLARSIGDLQDIIRGVKTRAQPSRRQSSPSTPAPRQASASSTCWEFLELRPHIRALKVLCRRPLPIVLASNFWSIRNFFLSHPILTPYYLMPLAMLSLWTLLFSGNARPRIVGSIEIHSPARTNSP
jgi:hypothetical protein